MKDNHTPFKPVGDRLRFLREQWQQSLKDVCSTLEIDETTLKAIEEGKSLPNEELLDLLISHFLLTEDQADDLRDLIDQVSPTSRATSEMGLPAGLEDMLAKQVVMYMPLDNRIVYTDAMHANVNDHGVILQFMQRVPGVNQPVPVSRVGMSREHAEKIIEVLTKTLKQYDEGKQQKFLPPLPPEKTSGDKAESWSKSYSMATGQNMNDRTLS